MITVRLDEQGEPFAIIDNEKYEGINLISFLSSVDKSTYKKNSKSNFIFKSSIEGNNLVYTNRINGKKIILDNYIDTLKAIRKVYRDNYKKIKENEKIKNIVAGGILGITAAGIALMVILSKDAEKEPELPEPEEISLDQSEPIYFNTETNTPEEETIQTSYIASANIDVPDDRNTLLYEPENIKPTTVDVKPTTDTMRDQQLDQYKDIIKERCEKWGINYNLFYDICATEWGGHDYDICQVLFDPWKDQVIKVFNFKDNRIDKIVLTDTPSRYAGKDIITITREDLYGNPKTNISVGAAILQYNVRLFKGNIPLAIQAYNNGAEAVKWELRAASSESYLTPDDYINDPENLDWMGYTSQTLRYGDPNYFAHVVSRITPEQLQEGLNDVYHVEYLNDADELDDANFRGQLRR